MSNNSTQTTAVHMVLIVLLLLAATAVRTTATEEETRRSSTLMRKTDAKASIKKEEAGTNHLGEEEDLLQGYDGREKKSEYGVGDKYIDEDDDDTDCHQETALSCFRRWVERHDKGYNYYSTSPSSEEHDDAVTLAEGKENRSAREEEFHRRLNVFANNLHTVRKHNEAYRRGWTSYRMTVEHSPFADMTSEEFEGLYLMEGQNCSATSSARQNYGGTQDAFMTSRSLRIDNNEVSREGEDSHKKKKNDIAPSATSTDGDDLPKSVDWRTKGVITPIKNQGMCGSCWTFSTTGTLESHYCLANQLDCTQWTGLAEQQLVDCASSYDNHGCGGGLPSHAFEYIHYSGGIDTEEKYPYRGKDEDCSFDSAGVGATVTGVHNITPYDEDEIVDAVAHVGPVSVAYQVAGDFHLYKHGVYDGYNSTTNSTGAGGKKEGGGHHHCAKNTDPEHVNHAVVVVGYGETMPTPQRNLSEPFYIIRNSWGNVWGMEGYFWMARGKNLCGVGACASYPIVEPSTDAAPLFG